MHPLLEDIQSTIQAFKPHLTAAGGFLAVGVAVGVLRISATANVPDQSETWSLPKITPPKAVAFSADDVGTRFWSEQPRATKKKDDDKVKKAPVIPWRFIGTVNQGAGLVAVIEIGGTKVKWMKAGEPLPDGAVISEISEGQLLIDRQGSPQTLRLFVEKKSE